MDVDLSEEKLTLEEFCYTPRTLVEIVDRFSGMKDLMDKLDKKDAHLQRLERPCIDSLHYTFHKGWETFHSRRQNTSVNHTNTKVAPLAQKFNEKADILLNKHAPTFDEYRKKFPFGPNFKGQDSSGNNIFRAEYFIMTYSSFKDRLNEWFTHKLGRAIRADTAPDYQKIFNRLGNDHPIWGDFDGWYRKHFYDYDTDDRYPTLPPGSNILDAQEFFSRYCCEGQDFFISPIGQGGLKKRWDFIRFSKHTTIGDNIPPSVQDKVRDKLIHSRNKGTGASFIRINSAYVQKYMQQLAIVEHYRETLATEYKARIPAIVDNIIQHVESGVLEVANEYSNEEKTPHAHFIFAARQQRTHIRDYGTNNEDIPFGTLVVQQGGLKIVHQRIAKRQTIFEKKARNKALRTNRTKQSFHGIEVPLMLSRLLPYYTPKCTWVGQREMPNYEYPVNKRLDTLTEQNSVVDDDSGNDDDSDDDFDDIFNDGFDDGCDEAMSDVGETKQKKRPPPPPPDTPDTPDNNKKQRTITSFL